MKTFSQYISEIFQPKTTSVDKPHPDYQGVNDQGQHVYLAGEVARDTDVESTISGGKIGDYSHAAEIEFRVNGSTNTPRYGWPKHVAQNIMRTVHSHLDHYIRSQKPQAVFYDTADPVRDRIYQMAAKQYKIPTFNYNKLKK